MNSTTKQKDIVDERRTVVTALTSELLGQVHIMDRTLKKKKSVHTKINNGSLPVVGLEEVALTEEFK